MIPAKPEHKFAEAFMLMTYYARATGEREVLWNSRNGVTPFIITSPRGAEMMHVDWQNDRYAPLHIPKVGDGIFIDLTEQRARVWADQYVQRLLKSPRGRAHLEREFAEGRESAVDGMAQQLLTQHCGGPHDIVIVTCGW